MADSNTQRTRRQAAQGDPAAHTMALLRARYGSVDDERLALLAFLGEPGARVAAEWEAGGNGRVYYRANGAAVGAPDFACRFSHGQEFLNDCLGHLRRHARSVVTGEAECPRCKGSACRIPPADGVVYESHGRCPSCGSTPGRVTETLEDEAMARAAVAAARVALPAWERNFGFEWTGADSLQRNAVDAGAAWVECPCEQHLDDWWEVSDPEHPDPELAGGGSFETWVVRPWDVSGSVDRGSWSGRIENLPHRILAAARLVGEQTVRAAIQRDLIQWVLGTREESR